MQIEEIKITEIKPFLKNPKIHSDKQVEKLANSIKEFGFNVPILLDKDNNIIAGHGRLLAIKKLNLNTVPVIRLEHLTPEQVKAYRIADNKLTESEWEYDFLKDEITDLKNNGFDITLTGFTDKEIEILLNKDSNNIYTKKIKAPIYTPSNIKPNISELYDDAKTKDFIKRINESNMSKENKEFLEKAAQRFIVFNYDKIANYYAYADKEVQDIMEKEALIIIDYNKAIENGFIRLTENLANDYIDSTEDKDE